jgi:tetratricopeptide (TPR) repeat protein
VPQGRERLKVRIRRLPEKVFKLLRLLNGWRIIFLSSLLLLGCAEAVKGKKPEIEMEKPVDIHRKEETPKRVSPLIEIKVIEQFIHEIDLDIAILERKKEESNRKGVKGQQLAYISSELERLVERKRILHEIKRISFDLDKVEDFLEKERLEKDLVGRLLDLSRLYQRPSHISEELKEREDVDRYRQFQEFQRDIQKAYSEKRFDDVLKSYRLLKEKYQDINIPEDISMYYAISLYKKGDLDKAIEELKMIIDGKTSQADPQYLKYLLGNWLYQAGRIQEALKTYKAVELETKMKKKWGDMAQLKIRMIEVGKGKASLKNKEEIKHPSNAKRKEEEEGLMDELEEIKSPTISKLHPESDSSIKGREDEEKRREEAMKILQQGNELFENEKFEEAIEIYKRLAGTPYEQMGKQRIQESMDRYADRERKEASELFLKGIKTTDLKEKREYFLKSLQILKKVNEKYPENRYSEKIKAYIQSVVRELKKVAPDFKQ